jgi:hypothetical protein
MHRWATVQTLFDQRKMPICRSRATVESIVTDKHTESRWRDPLSIGWQAHRGLLLLRLRWHASSTRLRAPLKHTRR